MRKILIEIKEYIKFNIENKWMLCMWIALLFMWVIFIIIGQMLSGWVDLENEKSNLRHKHFIEKQNLEYEKFKQRNKIK